MRHISPGRDAADWHNFNRDMRLFLHPALTFTGYALVTLGSVYGVSKMLDANFGSSHFLGALAIAALLQTFNAVGLPHATRILVVLGMRLGGSGKMLQALQHQKTSAFRTIVGLMGILICLAVWTVDTITNIETAQASADQFTEKPVEKKADTEASDKGIAAADKALGAEKEAERVERAAWDAQAEAAGASRIAQLKTRRGQLLSGKVRGTKGEANYIEQEMSAAKAKIATKKAAFVSKKSDVASALARYNKTVGQHSDIVMGMVANTDTLNRRAITQYESTKAQRKYGFLFLYAVAMAFLFFSNIVKSYRSLRFDEIHPPASDNPFLRLFAVLAEGISDAVWRIHATVLDWLPEKELESRVNLDLLDKAQSQICVDTLSLIHHNPGISEMGIYLALREIHPTAEVRQALKILKTNHLAYEGRGSWTVNAEQAGFFLSNP